MRKRYLFRHRGVEHKTSGQALVEFMLSLVVVFLVGSVLRGVLLTGRDSMWTLYLKHISPPCAGCFSNLSVDLDPNRD